MNAIQWRIGIGDPSLLGWAITIGYFLAALACLQAGRHLHGRSPTPGTALWFVLGLGLALLGLNKQLDLQTLVIEVGRWVALANGWYAQRRRIQLDFALTTILAGATTAALAAKPITCFRRQHPLAIAGCGLIAGYVCLRLLSINHVDDTLPHPAWLEDWLGWLELAGILLVLRGARRAVKPAPK